MRNFEEDGLDTAGTFALEKTVEFEIDGAIDIEDPAKQEEEENKPISKKDNAIKTLVNFSDLKKGKSVEEEKTNEVKPVYIEQK